MNRRKLSDDMAAIRERRAMTPATRGFCRVGEKPVVEMRPGVYDAWHNGDIAEIMVFDQALSGADLAAVSTWVSSRYGL